VVVGKATFLRQVMAYYGVEKPLFLTEASLICHPENYVDCNPPEERFYQAQADYLIRVNVRSWANDLAGIIWYKFEGPGWRYGGLLDEDQNSKPAFEAMKFLTAVLSGSRYAGLVASYENAEGYEFGSDDKFIWIMWSADEQDIQILLPDDLVAVYNKFGEDITPDTSSIIVNDPVYVEFEP
jgi:hypothetical protein